MLETSLHLTSEQLLILESFIQCTVETRTSASSVEVLEKQCCIVPAQTVKLHGERMNVWMHDCTCQEQVGRQFRQKDCTSDRS